MSLVHYNSGVFYAWIDGVLTTIPIGGGGGSVTNIYNNPVNQPFAFDGVDEPFEPILFGNQRIPDYIAFRDRTIDLLSGQIKFPATQNVSADPNTLDDYEYGNWTPVLTFQTPGNLSLTYTTQVGRYTKLGNLIFIQGALQTATFTHTTAGGDLLITGLPFSILNLTNLSAVGPFTFSGITKAGYTVFCIQGQFNTSHLTIFAAASGVGASKVGAVSCPSGGTMELNFSVFYRTN